MNFFPQRPARFSSPCRAQWTGIRPATSGPRCGPKAELMMATGGAARLSEWTTIIATTAPVVSSVAAALITATVAGRSSKQAKQERARLAAAYAVRLHWLMKQIVRTAHHQREGALHFSTHCEVGAIFDRVKFCSIALPEELDPTRWREHALLDPDVYEAINDFAAATSCLEGFYLRKLNEDLKFDPHPLQVYSIDTDDADPIHAKFKLEERITQLKEVLDTGDRLSDLLRRYRGTLQLPQRTGWEARAKALSGAPPPGPPGWLSRQVAAARLRLQRRI